MVQILRQRIAGNCMYFVLNRKSAAMEMVSLGFENVVCIKTKMRQGKYTPEQFSRALKRAKSRELRKVSKLAIGS